MGSSPSSFRARRASSWQRSHTASQSCARRAEARDGRRGSRRPSGRTTTCGDVAQVVAQAGRRWASPWVLAPDSNAQSRPAYPSSREGRCEPRTTGWHERRLLDCCAPARPANARKDRRGRIRRCVRNCQGDRLRLALRRYRLRKGPRKLHCVRSQPRCSDFRCRRPSDRAQRPVAEPDHHLDAGGGPTSRATLSGRSELSSHGSNYAQAKQCCDEFLTHHSLIGGWASILSLGDIPDAGPPLYIRIGPAPTFPEHRLAVGRKHFRANGTVTCGSDARDGALRVCD